MAAKTKFKIVALYLEREEVLYELEIRGFEGTTDINKMRKELGRLLKLEELKQPICYPEYDRDFNEEIQTIGIKQGQLRELIKEFTVQSDSKDFRVLNSRLGHLMGRCDRLKCSNKDERQSRAKAISNVIELGEELQHTLRLRRGPDRNESVSFIMSDDEVDAEPARIKASTPHNSRLPNDDLSREFPSHFKSVPVYKWNLKFTGDNKQMSVAAFLERVEELKIARGVSSEELFCSAIDLFDKRALSWYRGVRDRVNSWEQLKSELKAQFRPADYEYRLMEEIRRRTQGSRETMGDYLSAMHNLFSRLSIPLSEGERLQIIKRNIRPEYQDKLMLLDIETEAELLKIGRKIEEVTASKEAFVSPAKCYSVLEPDLAYASSETAPVSSVMTKAGKSSSKFKKFNSKQASNSSAINKTTLQSCETTPPSNSENNARTQKNEIKCFNCKQIGHIARGCTAPRKIHCYKCGKEGVITKDCCLSGNDKGN